MIRSFAILLAFAMAVPAQAADLIKLKSPHSVSVTMDKLAAAVEGAGAKVFARIDHAAGASSVDMELRPTQMLMFGNPKLGTPALQGAQSAGLDLPLRAVAWEAEDGSVWLAYHDPASLTAHGLPADAPVLGRMAGALKKLTAAAVAE